VVSGYFNFSLPLAVATIECQLGMLQRTVSLSLLSLRLPLQLASDNLECVWECFHGARYLWPALGGLTAILCTLSCDRLV